MRLSTLSSPQKAYLGRAIGQFLTLLRSKEWTGDQLSLKGQEPETFMCHLCRPEEMEKVGHNFVWLHSLMDLAWFCLYMLLPRIVSSKRVGLSQFHFSADGSAPRYPEGMEKDSQPNENQTGNILHVLC